MSNCTTTAINTKFCPVTWNLTCLNVGYTYSDEITFKDQAGAAIDISSDDFSMEVYDEAATLVHTNTIGSGLEIIGTNKLRVTIGAPVTDNFGTYTHKIIWTRVSTGENFPVMAGKIVVSA